MINHLNLLAATALSIGAVSAVRGQEVIFVDSSAAGLGDGSSWVDAFTTLQAALNAAEGGEQIWVAAGLYVENIVTRDNVAIYGGFSGGEDAAFFDLDERDWDLNETILHGDLTDAVVTVPPGTGGIARLDGFTIEGGGSPDLLYAGGILVQSSELVIANNRVVDNGSRLGAGGVTMESSSVMLLGNVISRNSGSNGAVHMVQSTVTLSGNLIGNNIARTVGGGIDILRSTATVSENEISGNTAAHGGALNVDHSTIVLQDNLILNNAARVMAGGIKMLTSDGSIVRNTIQGSYGIGIYLNSSSPDIIANLISESTSSGLLLLASSPAIVNNAITYNSADGTSGGGAWVQNDSSPVINGNLFIGNSASGNGGGLYVSGAGTSAIIVNNLFAKNRASTGGGGGLRLFQSPKAVVANNTFTGNFSSYPGGGISCSNSSARIVNCIIAYNSDGIFVGGSPAPLVTRNCVFGNGSGITPSMTGAQAADDNIYADPLFASAPDAGADGEWGTVDDKLGDRRLRSGSPCIDAGSLTSFPGAFDVVGHPRTTDGNGDGSSVLDVGAYEAQLPNVAGDFDGDGALSAADYHLLLAAFGRSRAAAGYDGNLDLDGDGVVTFTDCQYWIEYYRAAQDSPLRGRVELTKASGSDAARDTLRAEPQAASVHD